MPGSQFGAPHGVRGWLAAKLIGRLTAEANRWMIECLDVRSDDRVLDVGCGPGHGVALVADVATQGFVVGVDSSPTMVRQARGRNRAALREGRVEVARADAARLPFPGGHFGKAWSLNSMQFWPAPGTGLREMRRVLAPGGRVAIALMSRGDDPPAAAGPPPWLAGIAGVAGYAGAGGIAGLMEASGFGAIRIESREFGGVVHWALMGDSRRS